MSETLEEILTAYYGSWFAALTQPGTGELEALLTPEWRYTNYDGLVRGKAEYLAWAGDAMEELTFIGPYDLEVDRHGELAICLGGYRVLHGPGSDPLELRFTGVWARRDDRWQCLIHHNSRVTG